MNQLWAIDLQTKAFRSISTLTADATATANATALISPYNLATPGMGFIAGWTDYSTTPLIGYSGTTAGIGTASILTELIPVGTFLQKKTFKQVEIKLRSPLQSGESILVTPFSDGTVKPNLTFSPALLNGAISGVAPVTFQGSQWLQFSIIMVGNSASGGGRLYEMRLR